MPFEKDVELHCPSTGETRFFSPTKARAILGYTDEWEMVKSAAPTLSKKKKKTKKDAASKSETE